MLNWCLAKIFQQLHPKITFSEKKQHPNAVSNRESCVNVFKRNWTADYGIKHILLVSFPLMNVGISWLSANCKIHISLQVLLATVGKFHVISAHHKLLSALNLFLWKVFGQIYITQCLVEFYPIFYGKVNVNLKAMEKDLPEQWQAWIN